MSTFRNPIAEFDTPDPFVTFDTQTKYYYALFTLGNRLEIYRSKKLATLINGRESKVIFQPNGQVHGIYGDIRAPEMHKGTDGKWYIYTSGRIKPGPGAKRIFVMRALSSDPFGDWEFAGMPTPDIFSIDPTSYIGKDGIQYMCNSRVDPTYGQVLDIYKMKSPTEFDMSTQETICIAEKPWELIPPYVNNRAIVEGAFFVENNGRLFIIYSANGCWSDHYVLGVLEHTGGELCNKENWKKHDDPLLVYGNGAYGPGHATFFYSPDGTQLWCAYHAMKKHNENCVYDKRYLNVQRVYFDENGNPKMGVTIGNSVDIESPSGE